MKKETPYKTKYLYFESSAAIHRYMRKYDCKDRKHLDLKIMSEGYTPIYLCEMRHRIEHESLEDYFDSRIYDSFLSREVFRVMDNTLTRFCRMVPLRLLQWHWLFRLYFYRTPQGWLDKNGLLNVEGLKGLCRRMWNTEDKDVYEYPAKSLQLARVMTYKAEKKYLAKIKEDIDYYEHLKSDPYYDIKILTK